MIERIVVPLDGSLTAEAVLPHLRRVLHRNDSEVILVRVVVPPTVENSMLIVDAELGAAQEYIRGQAERLERAGVRVRHVTRVGSPVRVILDVVEEQKATMLALATHGSTGVKRLLFGSVAEGLLRKTPIPVLLVRPFWSYELVPPIGTEQRPVRNVLVPVDGSDRSFEALPAVVEFAELFESRVVLLRVLEEGRKGEEGDPVEAEKQLLALSKTIEKKGVETLRFVERGKAVDQILRAIQVHEIDLVAMTTHGRTGLSRVLTGSVTEEVLRQAPVPLLVIRNANDAEPGTGIPALKEVGR